MRINQKTGSHARNHLNYFTICCRNSVYCIAALYKPAFCQVHWYRICSITCFTLIDHLLIRKFRKQIRFWIGIILMVIILAVTWNCKFFIFIKQYLHLMILQVLIKRSPKSMYMSNRMMQPRALWMQPVIHLVFWQISIEKTQTLHYNRWQVRPVGK